MKMKCLNVLSFLTILGSSTVLYVPFLNALPLSCSPNGEAQESVSLQETLEKAYMQNADLDATRAELRSTDEEVSQANAAWRPSLSVQGVQSQSQTYPIDRLPNQTRTHGSSTGYTATLNQNIYQGGLTDATIGRAESNVLAGKAGLFNTEQKTLLTALQAHTGILTTQAIAEYQKQAVEFYKKIWEHAQARFEVGEGDRVDVEAAKGNYEGAVGKLSEAVRDFENTKAVYLNQVGSPPGKLAPANILLALPPVYEEALKVAKEHNPVVLQARYAVEAAEYFVRMQIAELLPTVGINGSVGNDRRGGTGNNGHLKKTTLGFEANVTIPLYAQGIPSSRIRQAYQRLAQQKIQLVGAQRNVVQDVRTAWDNLVAAREGVKGYLAQVKAQEIAVEGAQEAVNVGIKTIIDVLFLEQDLINAQINLATAQQTLVVASYQLLQAMGRLTARDLRLRVKYYDPDAYYNEYKDAWIQFWQGKDLRYVKEDLQ